MDWQTILNNVTSAHREARMSSSDQLTLGEMIAKFDAVSDKTKPVHLDFGGFVATDIDSWRGSYAELALGYGNGVPCAVETLLKECRAAVGATFEGYKGGDFRMSRHTPVWIANYGRSGVEGYKGSSDVPTVAVIDVLEADDRVLVVTAEQTY